MLRTFCNSQDLKEVKIFWLSFRSDNSSYIRLANTRGSGRVGSGRVGSDLVGWVRKLKEILPNTFREKVLLICPLVNNWFLKIMYMKKNWNLVLNLLYEYKYIYIVLNIFNTFTIAQNISKRGSSIPSSWNLLTHHSDTECIHRHLFLFVYVSVNLSNQAIYKLSENFRQFVKYLFQSVNLQIVWKC